MKELYLLRGLPGSGKSTLAKSLGGEHVEADQYFISDGEYLFDPEFKVKEDYEICLRHIRDKGGILAVRYLHWENEHWTTNGGCKDYRTIDMERDAIKRLIKLYPSMISSAKRKANEFTIKLNL